jgi:hypothetical protein
MVSNQKEQKVEDIYAIESSNIFSEICGVSIEEFKILVETGFINKIRMNRAIESFNIMESLV